MKILLINWQDPNNPRSGGAEVHLHQVFRRIRGMGHEVTWLASGWKGAAGCDAIDGMDIHRTGTRYTFGPACVRYFHRHLAAQAYDVVVEALNKVPLYTPLWCRHPVVLLVHHLFGTTAFREAPLPLAAATWIQERPLRVVYRGVPVQAISRSTAADLVDRGLDPQAVEVIHPGVDLDFFSPPSSPTRAVAPTFLYLGRLQRYKRVDTILQAFALARADLPSMRLVIAGKGDQEDTLRKYADALGVSESVDFVGYVSEERKRDLFRSSWANVFVSPKEGWGITNLEAGACGTATIASDAPGLRESVVRGRTGLLVPYGDAESLSRALVQLGRDSALTERLGMGAREFARGFTWDHTAIATEKHLLTSIHDRT